MAQIPVIPTPVTTTTNVNFVSSPLHINAEGAFATAVLRLWVWQGDVTTPYTANTAPIVTWSKAKVSSNDTYITWEISDIIKSQINPKLLFDFDTIAITGEGAYYQYEITTFTANGSFFSTIISPTKFALRGYNWDYEGQGTFSYNRGSFGFADSNIPKYYNPNINYFDGTLVLTGATTSNSMVKRTVVTPPANLQKCVTKTVLIIYLNKYGFYDTFTPLGKVTFSSKMDRKTYERTFRNPKNFVPTTDHSTTPYNTNSKQTIVVNTGIITEQMGELVEEILLSEKIYLVEFEENPNLPQITVDTTLITVDNTLITVDLDVLNNGFSRFRQIPVVVKDTDFRRLTRLNDRINVSYNIEFEQSNYKINNIR